MRTNRTTQTITSPPSQWKQFSHVSIVLIAYLAFTSAALGSDATNSPVKPERSLTYTNEIDLKGPLSVHIVKINLARSELRLYTTLGNGKTLGMSTVTEQLKALPPELGQPLAAINGDFYEESKDYAGRPRDVQIREGEVLTHPAGHSCFWIDPHGRPQMTNVYSRFRVVWPGGKTIAVGLNAERAPDAAMLYTSVVGPSTGSRGGIEYLLEGVPARPWLPLQAGQTYEARVRAVRNSGGTPLDRTTAVLSLGPGLGAGLPTLKTGEVVRLITETVPDLSGVQIAIGGGPALVKDGKAMEWKGWVHVRHPRTAVGWNEKYLYLVQVDGRQLDVSIGMTFSELAAYLLKLGCKEALNLDGGGSSTLWALGSVRNSPSEGEERPCPNTLVVLKKSPGPAAK